MFPHVTQPPRSRAPAHDSTVPPPQRFVLAEIIKLSQLDVGVLVDFIKSHGIQPNWMHMQLPGGRQHPRRLSSTSLPERKPPNPASQGAA